MPQHQSCCDREGDHQGCCGDRPPQQGLLPNVSIQLFPPGLDEAGLPALLTQQPASAGIFQFEAKAEFTGPFNGNRVLSQVYPMGACLRPLHSLLLFDYSI